MKQSSLFFTVHVSNCFTLEQQKECIVNCFIDNNSTIFDGNCLLFSPSFSKGKEKDLIAATALVTPNKSLIPVRFLNVSNVLLKVGEKLQVGTVEQCLESYSSSNINHIKNVTETESEHLNALKQSLRLNKDLSIREKEKIFDTLSLYSDVFSKDSSDIGFCSEIAHEIITPDSPAIHCPIHQIPYGIEEQVLSLIHI